MTCEKTTEQLIDWLEGELPPDAAAAVDEHVRGCGDCRREVDEIRRTLDAIAHPADEPGETYFASFYPRVRRRLEDEPLAWPARFWRWLTAPNYGLRAAATTAAVGLLVVAGLVAGNVLPFGSGQVDRMMVARPTLRHISPVMSVVRVDPALRERVDDMQGEEIKELQFRFAKMLVGRLTTARVVVLPGAVAGPAVADSPNMNDLDDDAIVEVAETLSKDLQTWTL